MSRVIYKITSKKATELLDAEKDRRSKFFKTTLRKVRKLMGGASVVADIAYREDRWENKIIPWGVVFTKEAAKKLDMDSWKKSKEWVVHKEKCHYVYTPKRNNKAKKEFATKLFATMPSESFFQSKEILESVGYKPQKKMDSMSPNMIRVTTFLPGWTKKGGKSVFVFGGYDGYKPVRGVKEILMSEYNKLMGEK